MAKNIVLIILLLLSTVSATEWFAPDVERSTFAAYIENYAAIGDTVYFPADTAIWNTRYTIRKGVILIGAGLDSTCIVSNYNSLDPLIIYEPDNYELNAPFRFSGFTLDCGGNCRGIYLGYANRSHPYKTQNKVRIDHNRFRGPKGGVSAQYIWNFTMYGVIDNNIFASCYYPMKSDPNADCTWWEYQTFTPGAEDDNMYFEDNTFEGIYGAVTDCQWSGRYVYRYNDITITNDTWPLFDIHGNGPSAGMCSSFGAEIYGNTIKGNFDVRLLDHRGGQALVFYNNKNSASDFLEISVREEYPDSDNPPATAPDGQPQHVAESYYWCNWVNYSGSLFTILDDGDVVGDIPLADRDFYYDTRLKLVQFNGSSGIGCGPFAKRPATCTKGVGYWATDQSVTNLKGKVGAHPDTVITGILYVATAENTWTEFYKPLPYPHPLRKPDPPKHLRFNK